MNTTWNDQYPKIAPPEMPQISAYISSPLWEELCNYLEKSYGVMPRIEYSGCGMAPGWNVKYKKNSRSLCTLYPAAGYFTALVSIGSKEATEAELLLLACTGYTQNLYQSVSPYNGSRWLMIDVKTPDILADVKCLIQLRVSKKK